MRVLVVEDEERIAAFLVKGLRAGGHDVEAVGTGHGALARATVPDGQRAPYDLLLLDLGLPDLDGLQVLQRLRQDDVRTPVLVVTARLAPEEEERAADLGADGYLRKPFAVRDLLAHVERLALLPACADDEQAGGGTP